MRRVLTVLFVLLAAWATWPASAQVTIPTSSTTSTTRPPSSSTSSSTSTTAGAATTAPRRTTTTLPVSTAPPKTTTTIPTPAPSPATTAAPEPAPKHSGHFSPLFTWLFALGTVSGLGLLALQWLLTKPGRHGWTL